MGAWESERMALASKRWPRGWTRTIMFIVVVGKMERWQTATHSELDLTRRLECPSTLLPPHVLRTCLGGAGDTVDVAPRINPS